MQIRTLEVGWLQTNCYVVTPDEGGLCVVIDPGGDSSVILDYIEDNRLTCAAILLTHGHFDHCMGVAPLLEEISAPLYMSSEDINRDIGNAGFTFVPPDDTHDVEDGDVLTFGSLRFEAIACPGHTPGGLTYKIEDTLFTGDTLFRQSIGRTDFPAGDPAAMRRSLMRLRELPGNFDVLPGHGGQSTLDFERGSNPYMNNLSLVE